ncbi:MAG: acylneuraminate cytidylyltransferase family protein [Candidatus Omnitrophica bacterium]|nr:acylneuraminate cytidylyltransferase family protein [Candidatus Omnitrophota bacterium]
MPFASSALLRRRRPHKMVNGQTAVGIVVARGGSKGLPGKNLRRIGPYPLVACTILAAKRSRLLDRVMLSTDSPQIAAVGRRFGAEVPFLRPKSLARDTTHTPPVIEHAIRYLERTEGYRVDIVVTLQPTSPFRRPEHIDSAVRMLARRRGLTSVITVEQAAVPPFWMFRTRGGRLVPFVQDGTDYLLKERQQLPKIVQPNGAVYVTRRSLLRSGVIASVFDDRTTGYLLMDRWSSVDIDEPMDLAFAQQLLRQHPALAWWKANGRHDA